MADLKRHTATGQWYFRQPGNEGWVEVSPQVANAIKTLGPSGAAAASGAAKVALGTGELAARGLEALSPAGSGQEAGSRTMAEGLERISGSLDPVTAQSPVAAGVGEFGGLATGLAPLATRAALGISRAGARAGGKAIARRSGRAAPLADDAARALDDSDEVLRDFAGNQGIGATDDGVNLPNTAVDEIVRSSDDAFEGTRAQGGTIEQAQRAADEAFDAAEEQANAAMLAQGGDAGAAAVPNARMINEADDVGYKLLPYQRAQGPVAEKAGEILDTTGVGKAIRDTTIAQNKDTVTGAVVRLIGGRGDDLTDDVLENGYEYFDDLARQATNYDSAGEINRQSLRTLADAPLDDTVQDAKHVFRELQQTLGKVADQTSIRPKDYVQLRRKLGRIASLRTNRDKFGPEVTGPVMKMLDDLDKLALDAGWLRPGAKARFDDGWNIFKELEFGAGAVDDNFKVKEKILYNRLRRSSTANRKRLRGSTHSEFRRELAGVSAKMDPQARRVLRLLKVSKRFAQKVPSSGTSERLLGFIAEKGLFPAALGGTTAVGVGALGE